VLLVADPRYDIRALHHARSDVLTLAWPRGKAALGPSWPGGTILAPCWRLRAGPLPADALVQLLGPQRWRLRVRVQGQ
jgi:hypothetical protein